MSDDLEDHLNHLKTEVHHFNAKEHFNQRLTQIFFHLFIVLINDS